MRKPRYVIDEDEEDGPDVIPDGGSVRVPLYLCDSVQSRNAPVVRAAVVDAENHRPHFATLTDAQVLRRQLARDEMIRRAENSWRTMGRDQKPPDDPDEDDPDEDDVTPYDAYKKRLSRAWRVPIGVGPGEVGPRAGSYVGAGDSFNRRALLSKDAADARRNTAWDDYVSRLNNAWRS